MRACAPGAAGLFVYGIPAPASVLLAMSQELANRLFPMGSNCTEQSAGSAITTTGECAAAAVNAGLALCASDWNPGTKLTAARPRPNSITGLRPVRSESHAKL